MESILSYTGIIDPTTGRGFGRVVETGGKGSALYSITERWDAAAMTSLGVRTGKDVADNVHTTAELSLSYDLKLPKFDSFTVGPEYSFEVYRLTDHWSLGGLAHVERSPQFNEWFTGISLRFSFGARSSLMSTDIPAFPLH